MNKILRLATSIKELLRVSKKVENSLNDDSIENYSPDWSEQEHSEDYDILKGNFPYGKGTPIKKAVFDTPGVAIDEATRAGLVDWYWNPDGSCYSTPKVPEWYLEYSEVSIGDIGSWYLVENPGNEITTPCYLGTRDLKEAVKEAQEIYPEIKYFKTTFTNEFKEILYTVNSWVVYLARTKLLKPIKRNVSGLRYHA